MVPACVLGVDGDPPWVAFFFRLDNDGAEELRPHSQPQQEKATGNRSPVPPLERADLTLEERQREVAKWEFFWAAIADVKAYDKMTVQEVEDEYRHAGKLHRYDPDNEWKKRMTRVARKHPLPEGLIPGMDEYLKLLKDDEKN
ncbi:hypothetical protein QOZ80_1AG0002700 [Eleusine coracana subsp. coracana]|nr:hypothetical protein QOZ80_1AG0002700 [Eleusine coracana subsp. coracana]